MYTCFEALVFTGSKVDKTLNKYLQNLNNK